MVKKDYRFNRILCDTVHDKQWSVLYIQSETPLFSIFLIYLFANDAIIQKFGDSKIYIYIIGSFIFFPFFQKGRIKFICKIIDNITVKTFTMSL